MIVPCTCIYNVRSTWEGMVFERLVLDDECPAGYVHARHAGKRSDVK